MMNQKSKKTERRIFKIATSLFTPPKMNYRKISSIIKDSLVILTVLLDLLLAVVVLVGVALLVRPGQPVHQVVRRLVRDVAQQSLHERQVMLQLVLDRIP